ncbi:MAG: AAA family ATPase [Hyphomicrobium sp.]|jgi:hypothetical protein
MAFRERDGFASGDGPIATSARRNPSLWIESDGPEPPLAWFVDGLIPRGDVTVVAGIAGSGKTAAVLTAMSANGSDWLGRRVHFDGACLWLAYEAQRSTKRRVRALGLGGRVCVDRHPPNLLDPGAVEDIEDKIDETREIIGREVDAVVVDALADALEGGDENSFRDMTTALRGLLRLAEQRGVTVIVIAHRGLSSDPRPRGHSSINGHANVLAIMGDARTKRLKTVKLRDAEDYLPDIKFQIINRNGAPAAELLDGGGAKAWPENFLSSDALALCAVIANRSPATTWDGLRDHLVEALLSVKKRSAGAIRKALSTNKISLFEKELIRFDGGVVTVTDRYRGVTSNAVASSGALPRSVTVVPPLGGDGNVGNAPTWRPKSEGV